MLDFCLLHYLLTTDSEAMTHHKYHHSIHYFSKLLTKKNETSPLLNYLKSNTSKFGSAIQVLPSDIGEYFSSFFNAVVVVVFISIFSLQLETVFI